MKSEKHKVIINYLVTVMKSVALIFATAFGVRSVQIEESHVGQVAVMALCSIVGVVDTGEVVVDGLEVVGLRHHHRNRNESYSAKPHFLIEKVKIKEVK